MHTPLLPVPVVPVFPMFDSHAELIAIARVPAFLLLVLLLPAKTFGRQHITLGAEPIIESCQFAAPAGPVVGVAFVLVVVVIVETVVVAIVFTVDWRQVFGASVDAVAF